MPPSGGEGAGDDLRSGARADGLGGQDLPPAARPGMAVEEPDHVARHVVEPRPAGESAPGVDDHRLDRRLEIGVLRGAIEAAVHLGEERRIVVGGAADHHAIDGAEQSLGRIERLDPAIDADEVRRDPRPQTPHTIVVERRHRPIFLGAEAGQPGLSGVDPEGVGAGGDHAVGERVEGDFRVLLVDAEAALDR